MIRCYKISEVIDLTLYPACGDFRQIDQAGKKVRPDLGPPVCMTDTLIILLKSTLEKVIYRKK